MKTLLTGAALIGAGLMMLPQEARAEDWRYCTTMVLDGSGAERIIIMSPLFEATGLAGFEAQWSDYIRPAAEAALREHGVRGQVTSRCSIGEPLANTENHRRRITSIAQQRGILLEHVDWQPRRSGASAIRGPASNGGAAGGGQARSQGGGGSGDGDRRWYYCLLATQPYGRTVYISSVFSAEYPAWGMDGDFGEHVSNLRDGEPVGVGNCQGPHQTSEEASRGRRDDIDDYRRRSVSVVETPWRF